MKVRNLLTGIIWSLLVSCSSAPTAGPGAMTPTPVPVSVAQATEEMVPIQVRSVGNVEAYSSVGVKALVGGQLLNVKFAEGANVAAGDLLFEIDSRPFREALRQAEAVVRKDEAELRVAEANIARDQARLKNAQAESQRFEQLLKEGIATRSREDEFRTAAEVAAQSVRADLAALESIRASLESGRSAVEQAKLNLGYTEIRAPITGRTGNLLLHPGNLVQANGDKPLVVINQVAPIYVTFGVPERYLGAITARQGSRQKLAIEVKPEGTAEPLRGTLSVIDNAVDSTTGTIRLKGSFENRNRQLWPGQFVNVVMTLETQRAIVIPAEAIQSGQQGSFVYVVKQDQSVEPRPVMTSQTVNGKALVDSGIMAGETGGY
ncbi:MAG TPA: efflux RND transporter periplasmic adaptor subunit [Terriglobia bacterium]|nr:efflux RND transporter periplasmic adaptor subunit [Terriglobia bacterium]